jgi:hypothetical protein
MIEVKVEIKNLDRLRKNFEKAPSIALKYLSAAVKASIFEIEKQALDKNFQFKWPRGMRTGYLQRSFDFGRYFDSSGLRASIGPTAEYAPYVYFGTNRGIRPNPYMDRIAKQAEGAINKHFGAAADKIIEEIA